MKKANKIIFASLAVAAAGLVIYAASRHKTKNMLTRISDEGYETAHDVLFPSKEKRDRKLQYGPVLPTD